MFNSPPVIQCQATISDPRLRENLRQCAEILGGAPIIKGNTVIVVVSDDTEKMIDLFEQFPCHEIKSLR